MESQHRLCVSTQVQSSNKTLHFYLNIPHMNLILVNLLVGQVVKEHFHILLNLSDFFFCEVCSDERFSLINVTWNVHIRRLIHKNVPKEWTEGFEVAAVSCLLLLIYTNHQLEKKTSLFMIFKLQMNSDEDVMIETSVSLLVKKVRLSVQRSALNSNILFLPLRKFMNNTNFLKSLVHVEVFEGFLHSSNKTTEGTLFSLVFKKSDFNLNVYHESLFV